MRCSNTYKRWHCLKKVNPHTSEIVFLHAKVSLHVCNSGITLIQGHQRRGGTCSLDLLKILYFPSCYQFNKFPCSLNFFVKLAGNSRDIPCSLTLIQKVFLAPLKWMIIILCSPKPSGNIQSVRDRCIFIYNLPLQANP